MPRSALISLLVLSNLLPAGCSRLAHNSKKSYSTVVADTQHDPELARAECERAAHLFEKGHLEKAEAALQDALIADVTYAPAHNNLGLIYFNQGKLYPAAWEFEYARRLLPDSADVANNLGMVYEAANQPERAIEYYSMALSIDQGNPEYTGNLARLLAREDRDPQQVAALLQDLLLNDSRPEWVAWANDQVHLRQAVRMAAHSQPVIQSSSNSQADSVAEEVEPLPSPSQIDDLIPLLPDPKDYQQ